jgi:hypothetical protein
VIRCGTQIQDKNKGAFGLINIIVPCTNGYNH